MKNIIFNEDMNFQEGDEHEALASARTFLAQLGYFGPQPDVPTKAVTEAVTLFDDNLTAAVSKYQAFHGLPVTGQIDEATRQMMEMPRCGVADLSAGAEPAPGVASFVASGGQWTSNNLTYKFVNGTADLAGDAEQDFVRQAFQVWADVTPLTFTEVVGQGDADFLVSWVTGDHGDGSSFDGPGHVLAHAFFPPPINPHPGIAGDVHFDDAETWADTHGGGNIDLLTVAIHEIGHSLGLRHSNVGSAIMFPTYNGIRHDLDADDIAGIQSIYGPPTPPPPPPPPQPTSFWERLIQWLKGLFGL